MPPKKEEKLSRPVNGFPEEIKRLQQSAKQTEPKSEL